MAVDSLLSVCVFSMADVTDGDYFCLGVYLVDYPIISNSDPIVSL